MVGGCSFLEGKTHHTEDKERGKTKNTISFFHKNLLATNFDPRRIKKYFTMHWNHATLESLCGSTWLSSSFKEMSRWRRRWTRMWTGRWRWWTSGWRCWKLPSLCFNRCTWLAYYYKEMRIKEKSKSFRHVDPFPRASDVLSRREELCFIMQTRQFHRRVDSPRQNWDPLMLSQGALEPPQGAEASVPRAPNLVRPLILLWYP